MDEDTTTGGTGRPRLPPKIVIDPQFRDLLEPHKDDEYAQLKANIERDGQTVPCVVWESDDGSIWTMIEGHGRHRANQELGRETICVPRAFDDGAHAKRYIFEQHKGRRNSTVAQFRKVLAALDAADEKRKDAAARRAAGRALDEAPYPDGRVSPGDRAPTVNQQIAKEQGVPRNVVDQTALIQKHPDLVAKVKSGEMTLEKAASTAKMRKLNNDPPAKGKPRKPKAKKPDKPEDIRRNCTVTIKTFRAAFENDHKPLDKAIKGQPPEVVDPLAPELTKTAAMLEGYAKTIRSWIGTKIEDAA